MGRAWQDVPQTPLTNPSQDFALTSPTPGGVYRAAVRALAGGSITGFAVGALTYQDVPGPSIVLPMRDDSQNHKIIASWSFDPEAAGLSSVAYVAELRKTDDSLVSQVTVSVKTADLSYPNSTPDGETLKVRVRATGNGLLGLWSGAKRP